jgi:hypothetical protein
MAGLIEDKTRIENRRLDTCLHDKELELCISLLSGHVTWAFCFMIRNTLIMPCKELRISTQSVAMPL